MSSGHLFVVHSRMENLQYDAAVVPTDDFLAVRQSWHLVLGVPRWGSGDNLDMPMLRPEEWPTDFMRVPSAPGVGPRVPTWFINVGLVSATPDDVGALANKVRGVLTEIALSVTEFGNGRVKPLIALPTLGVGAGGFDEIRGRVIDTLLKVCQGIVESHNVDVVITASNASDYSAFQRQRRHLATFSTLTEPLRAKGRELARFARTGNLALFLGAGVSVPAGLPSWNNLLESLAHRCGMTSEELKTLDSALDQAELITRRLGGSKGLKSAITDEFVETTTPGMSHVQLAALDCGEVVTTNYDSLFEAAVNANRDESSRITVLPFEQKKPFNQWILKMHGDLVHDGDLILSRSDFVGYASTFGPVGAIVQAIMLTKHLLVVGTSLTDDNFLRLAYEVTNYLRTNAPDRQLVAANPLGTVLDLDRNPVKESLWEGTFDVVGVSNSMNTNDSARDLSIMLDFIAMHAAEESHLLDQRYDTLLTQPGEKDAAAHALSLAREIEPLASAEDDPRSGWRRLDTLLRDLGAPARSA